MNRQKLLDIQLDLKSRGKIPPGRAMNDDAVIAFCVETVHWAMTKRLRRDTATARNAFSQSAEEQRDAEKIQQAFGHSEQGILLARNQQELARRRGGEGDAEKIAQQFGHTVDEVRRQLNGPADAETQLVQDVLGSSAAAARQRPATI